MKYRRPNILVILAGSLTFFLPMLALIPYIFLVDGFIPSVELRLAGAWFAVVSGAAATALIGKSTIDEIEKHWSSSHRGEAIRTAGMLLFSPIFAAAIGYKFIQGPVNYVFHVTSTSGSRIFTERVIGADDFGGRRCRNSARLENHTVLWHRTVCGISDETVTSLRRGGYIQLEGNISLYGIVATRYAVVSTPIDSALSNSPLRP